MLRNARYGTSIYIIEHVVIDIPTMHNNGFDAVLMKKKWIEKKLKTEVLNYLLMVRGRPSYCFSVSTYITIICL